MSVIDTFLAGAIRHLTTQLRLKGGFAAVTLTGAVTITNKTANLLALDPGGASRDVTLPPEETSDGAFFLFYNTADAAENLVIKNDAAATVVTIGRGETYIVGLNTGATWTAVPLREVEGAAGLLAADTISEFTAATGVTIDGLRIQDSTIKPAAGGTAFIDLSAVATGEADIVIKDNLASALEIRESTNVYATVVSTDNGEQIDVKKRLTVTDGVASGTARVVGGLAYSSTAASAAHTNSTTETIFDTNYSIPANTLKAGSVVKIRYQGIATATNAADTLTVVLRIGGLTGTALITHAATDAVNDDIFAGDFTLVVRTVGAGGTCVGTGMFAGLGAAGTPTMRMAYLPSTTIDTTAAQVVCVSADWSAADPGNSARLDVLTVEIA